MSAFVTGSTISSAWVNALEHVLGSPGRVVTNLMVTVEAPQEGAHSGATVVVEHALRQRGMQGVLTVASTIFPKSLYNHPGFDFAPELPSEAVANLDSAAEELYEAYRDSLPLLRSSNANNRRGTYFSRMISWPGKDSAGFNQLDRRVTALRRERELGKKVSNMSDIAIAGEADQLLGGVGGSLEEYSVTDTRTQGFPCLVHIDISVNAGRLSILAVYRSWHLLTRGYGNLIGLARLQAFLAHQTGYEPGELAVVAGHADPECNVYGGLTGLSAILGDVQSALETCSPRGAAT